MAISLSSPITGAAQTSFTSPTYTIGADQALDTNAKQWYVAAMGGTQSGVLAHSIACPFTITFVRPKAFKSLGKANPVTGLISSVGKNVYKCISRKGVLPLAGQPYQTMLVTTVMEVPAGADTADAANIRGCMSAHIGALSQISAGIGDTLLLGNL